MSLTEARWYIDVPAVTPRIDGVLSVATTISLAAGDKALVGAEYETDACDLVAHVWPGDACTPVDLAVGACVDPAPLSTGATAGTPGSWTPAPPASRVPTLQNIVSGQVVVTASPATHWAQGQYVVTADGVEGYWDGTTWKQGRAPVPPPAITALSPNSLPSTAAATTITVTGSGFAADSMVRVGGTGQATTFVNATTLTFSYDPIAAVVLQVDVYTQSLNDHITNKLPLTITSAAQYNPTDHTVDEVKAHVNALPMDSQRASLIQAILDIERANKNRSTLVTWLDEQLGVV